MPLGDSITDGFNVPGGYRIDLWRKLAASGYRIDFVGSQFNGPASLGDHDHEGHSGWTIAQIDANVTNWLAATNPRTVLLHIGTNDMFGGSSGHISAVQPDRPHHHDRPSAARGAQASFDGCSATEQDGAGASLG